MSKEVTLRLRAALQEGEASGWIDGFSLDDLLAEMHKEAKSKKVPVRRERLATLTARLRRAR